MNKQRKTIVVLLGVAMLALIVDRVMLDGDSGPQSAAADATISQVPATSPTVTPTPADNDDATIVLARQLELLQQSEQFNLAAVPNAFEAPSTWVQPKIEIVQHDKTKPIVPATDIVEKFIDSHDLIAALGIGEGGTAIVNGKRWTVGFALDGWTLTTITTRTAVFEKDGKKAVLQIAEPEIPNEEKDNAVNKR